MHARWTIRVLPTQCVLTQSVVVPSVNVSRDLLRLKLHATVSTTLSFCLSVCPSCTAFVKGGENRASTSLCEGYRAGSRGKAANNGIREAKSPECESFLVYFFVQKRDGPKVHDLNDSSSPCPRKTASHGVQSATNQLGDSHLGDNQLGASFRSIGRHNFDQLSYNVSSTSTLSV